MMTRNTFYGSVTYLSGYRVDYFRLEGMLIIAREGIRVQSVEIVYRGAILEGREDWTEVEIYDTE